MIKLKVIILPIKFEQRENNNKKKTKQTLWEGHCITCPHTQHPRHPLPESRKSYECAWESLPHALSLGSPLSISEQLLIVS